MKIKIKIKINKDNLINLLNMTLNILNNKNPSHLCLKIFKFVMIKM